MGFAECLREDEVFSRSGRSPLTLFRNSDQLKISIKLHAIKSRWFIVDIEESQVIIFPQKKFSVVANNADPDEMLFAKCTCYGVSSLTFHSVQNPV